MARYRSPRWFFGKAQARLNEMYYRSPLSKQVTPRRTQVYCVGTAKSGTHSVASLFDDQLRTFHEADWQRVINLVLGVAEGSVAREALLRHLVKRDRQFALDIDSSQLNYFYLRELMNLFPGSKFILTIRDPYTWLDSIVNHQLARGRPPHEWQRLRDFRFAREHTRHPPEEHALKAKGLYTLDGYLSYWTKHNRDVLEIVPQEQLLVVRTDQITERADAIARFVGLPPEDKARDAEKSHAFKALKKFGVLSEVDPAYLNEKVYQHCHGLVREHFPERLPTFGSVSPPQRLQARLLSTSSKVLAT